MIQLGKMAENGRRWLKEHPGQKPQIQILNPRLPVVGTIEDAVGMGFIKCDALGLEFIKALYPWGLPDTPTFQMVSDTLEVIYAGR